MYYYLLLTSIPTLTKVSLILRLY